MTNTGPTSIEQHAAERLARMETDLAALQRELDHTHRLATLGTIAALSAHEVNNILTGALGYAQLARSRPADPESLGKVVDRLETASRILAAILDFASPPDSGAGSDDVPGVEPAADVGEALDGALDCLGRDLVKDGITMVRSISREAVPRVRVLALQQVLLNLLLNARRVLRNCRGQITIASAMTPKGAVEITVCDDGPGIAPEIADTLFEPFVSYTYSGEPGPADGDVVEGGVGLGLTVCRRLVEAAGGTISAGEGPGGGAAFTIVLPAAGNVPVRKAS